MSSMKDRAIIVSALKHAAPYIRLFKGKVFVIKAGGGVFGDPEATRGLIEQIAILHYFGVRVVFVHGGGWVSGDKRCAASFPMLVELRKRGWVIIPPSRCLL